MRVVVDDPGHERQAVGGNGLPGGSVDFPCLGYFLIRNRQIPYDRRRAQAVEQEGAADDKVVHRRVSILIAGRLFGTVKLFELENKTAIITGAGRGIGAATAELFASAGAAVAIVDKYEQYAVRTAETITRSGGKALAVVCDVTQEEEVEEVFDRIS